MILLDSQAAIWWLTDAPRLSDAAASAIEGAADVAISAASIWELEIKRFKGKFGGPSLLDLLPATGFGLLSIAGEHAQLDAYLPAHHADPFDRVIVAQAVLERRTLITSDALLRSYDVPIIW